MTPERFQKLKDVLARRQPDLSVVADGVHKARNLAALLRTCDAVGVWHAHAVAPRGGMRRHHMIAGGVHRWIDVTLHRTIEAAWRMLSEDGWQLIAADSEAGALDYRDADYTGKVAFVLGSELRGLSRYAIEHAHARVALPMRGMGASLNVSVAGALLLFEAARQREAAGLYLTSRLSPEDAERTLFEWAYPEIARRCRERGRAYPRLEPDGRMSANPLTAGDDTQR
jgi:tRNA (guanosine-2'-O-)-methyltransferase